MILKSKYIYLCGLGNSLEFFEFTLFGFVAPLIQKIFWASGFEVSLSSTYLVFSIGLVARPLGLTPLHIQFRGENALNASETGFKEGFESFFSQPKEAKITAI